MFPLNLFTKAYVLRSKELHAFLKKKWRYNRDLFSDIQRERFQAALYQLATLQKTRLSSAEGEERLKLFLHQYQDLLEQTSEHRWRENVEVLFVALVIALAVRAYFLQPFKIPTHSMRPTLYGIVQEQRTGPKPSILHQIYDFARLGRSYHRLVVEREGTLTSIGDKKLFGFLPISVTEVKVGADRYTLWCTTQDLEQAGYSFNSYSPIPAGTELINFSIQNGDHLFVNKMAYHFSLPKRGDIFVFSTHGIAGVASLHEYTQYYIKRCVGVGEDELRIDSPYLYVNGEVLHRHQVFEKIYSMGNGYHGYVNGQTYLTTPKESYRTQKNQFWAMGDNSKGSFDSRGWGPVARENLVGSALCVYWPFSSRWGFVDSYQDILSKSKK